MNEIIPWPFSDAASTICNFQSALPPHTPTPFHHHLDLYVQWYVSISNIFFVLWDQPTWWRLSFNLRYRWKTDRCRFSTMLTLTKPNRLLNVPGPPHKRKRLTQNQSKLTVTDQRRQTLRQPGLGHRLRQHQHPRHRLILIKYQTGMHHMCSTVFTQIWRRG